MTPLLNAYDLNFFLKISQLILPVEDRCPDSLWREDVLSWHSFAAQVVRGQHPRKFMPN